MTAKTVKRSGIPFLLLAPLLLSACASAPQVTGEQKSGTPAGKQQTKPGAKAPEASQSKSTPQAASKPQAVSPPLPNVELDSKLLYEFLVGEVALQRGHPELSAQAYLDLARDTRDPRVARRAAQIAYESRQTAKAVEAFKLWLELEPDSQPARQMLISMLLATGKLDETRPWLAQFLAADPENAGAIFRQLSTLLARSADKAAALKLVRDLAQPYPNLAEAHLAVARAAVAAGKQDEALPEVRRARTLRPDWDEALMFEVQLLQPTQPEKALAALKEFLAANPDAGEVRLSYARMLLDRKQFKEARVEFQRLLDSHPENADLAFAVALLSLQVGDLDHAEKQLQQSLTRGKKDRDTVFYYLGQLNEAKKDSPVAIQDYNNVRGGEYAYPARLRTAYLLSTMGKLNEARDQLHQIHTQDQQQKLQLLIMEAAMLRDARQNETAYQLLQQGLEKYPDQPDLLYEAALLADRLGKPDVMEQLMRKLIASQPDNANALNALGYSFLERNVRIEEGMQLVEKAYQLAPNDAAIMDSMGWGHYRQGRLEKSLEFLRRAYAANPDPEIAAHLGEVLWVHGDKDEAKKILTGALKQNPQSEPLQQVTKKYLQK
jgi:tetratricopeptide (TPR) repeat protein